MTRQPRSRYTRSWSRQLAKKKKNQEQCEMETRLACINDSQWLGNLLNSSAAQRRKKEGYVRATEVRLSLLDLTKTMFHFSISASVARLGLSNRVGLADVFTVVDSVKKLILPAHTPGLTASTNLTRCSCCSLFPPSVGCQEHPSRIPMEMP